MSDAAARSGAPPSEPAILGHFRSVRQVFGEPGREIVAIDDISFDLARGTLVSLLGPSGCGKTSFLRIVGGLARATGGVVEVGGEAVARPHRGAGFVFQQPNLMPWRTVLRNVTFPLELSRRMAGAERKARGLLELTGLGDFADYYPAQLSGGMQQRTALCRALVHEPALLLMDEPFGALDELTRMEMHDLLLDLRRTTGTTILFVTHSISEAVYLSDRIVVFSRRPAVIADLIDVDIPYPRRAEIRYDPYFTQLEHRASRALGIAR